MSLNGLAFIFIWITALIFLSRAVDHLLRRSLGPTAYMVIVTPGVAVHELGHALGCFLTGARVVEIRLMSKHGGYVKHTQPRIPIIGPVVISLFPLFDGVLFIWIIAMAMDYTGIGLLDPADPISTAGRLAAFFIANFLRWHFWIFLYLLISVSASIGPSNRDIQNCILGLGLIAAILAAIIAVSPLLASWLDVIARPLMSGLNLALFLLLFSLLLVVPWYLVKRQIGR